MTADRSNILMAVGDSKQVQLSKCDLYGREVAGFKSSIWRDIECMAGLHDGCLLVCYNEYLDNDDDEDKID